MLKFIIKRFLLIITGIVLSLVFLEFGLRLAGWTVSSYQQYKNNKVLKNKTQYTIMCLGESTTAGQYPIQLQQLLDKKYPNKFSVIDCGIPATNLDTILNNLDNNIKKYSPDIAICMMGGLYITEFNDENTNTQNIFFKLKIIKIIISIKKYFSMQNKARPTEQILENIPKDEMSKSFTKGKEWYYKTIFEDCHKKNNIKNLEHYIDKAITEDCDIFTTDLASLLYNYIKDYIKPEQENMILRFIIHDIIYNKKEKAQIKKAEILLKNILKNNPNDEIAFNKLCILYNNFPFLSDNLDYSMAIEALNKKFSFEKEQYYKVIFQFCIQKSKLKELNFFINKAIAEDWDIFTTEVTYLLHNYIKDYITNDQREKILQVMTKSNYNDKNFGIIAMEYFNKKEYQKAQEYFNKAEEIRLNFPNVDLYNVYRLIVKKLIDNNIKVICMQYPVRTVLPLKEQLKTEPYYDKITFISNEKLFKDALMNKNYYELFTDQIAGDFGHCTESGNTMIAENVVNTLESILDLRQKSN